MLRADCRKQREAIIMRFEVPNSFLDKMALSVYNGGRKSFYSIVGKISHP
jgi:hypothetical protein